MSSPLSGTISKDEGLREAFEFVVLLKEVQNGILQVSSNDLNGNIGIFCAKYITGALISNSGESGHQALKKLLAVKDGTFKFKTATQDEVADLKQSLSIDINSLLEWNVDLADNIASDRPLLEESLIGLVDSGDTVFDSDADLSYIEEPLYVVPEPETETSNISFAPESVPVETKVEEEIKDQPKEEAAKLEEPVAPIETAAKETPVAETSAKKVSSAETQNNKSKDKKITKASRMAKLKAIGKVNIYAAPQSDILKEAEKLEHHIETPMESTANEAPSIPVASLPEPSKAAAAAEAEIPVIEEQKIPEGEAATDEMNDYLQTVQGIKSIRSKQSAQPLGLSYAYFSNANFATIAVLAGVTTILVGLLLVFLLKPKTPEPAKTGVTTPTTVPESISKNTHKKQTLAMQHYRLAQTYVHEGNYAKAAAEYKKVIALDSGFTYAKEELIRCQGYLRRQSKSGSSSPRNVVYSEETEKDITAGITDKRVLVAKGYQALQAGLPTTATVWLSKALQQSPNDQMARRYLAHALFQGARFRDAIAQFDSLANLDQADRVALGKCYAGLDNNEKAADIFQSCVDKDPSFAQARVELIHNYMTLGLKERARKVCLEGLRLARNKQEWQTFKNLLLTIPEENAPRYTPRSDTSREPNS